jgi:hypothetical protein
MPMRIFTEIFFDLNCDLITMYKIGICFIRSKIEQSIT